LCCRNPGYFTGIPPMRLILLLINIEDKF
jgi:hypothetical protein